MTPTRQSEPDEQAGAEREPRGAEPRLAAVPGEAAPNDGASEAEPIAVVPIEDVIDLHGFQPRDIPSVVEEYLLEAQARGFREVRLIHGRGTGFQRQRVQQLLSQHPLVERFADAPAYRGGWGATLVWLKPGS